MILQSAMQAVITSGVPEQSIIMTFPYSPNFFIFGRIHINTKELKSKIYFINYFKQKKS